MKHIHFLILLPLFFLLLARNPFSTRTLIPNFEPFPDGFHYVTSARCMLAGYGRTLCREGRTIKPSVPPLYSWYLIPFFLIKNDARMFYFGNILLSLASLFLFYLLLRHFVKQKSIQFLIVFLYITNYFTHWYPTLAMAENLLIPIFLLCLYLLLQSISYKRAAIFFFASFCLFGAKYSAAPIVIVFYLLYGIKLYRQRKTLKHLPKLAAGVSVAILFGFLISGGSELVSRGINLVQNILFKEKLGLTTSTASSATWISTVFIKKNLPLYLQALAGGSIYTLWVKSSFVPQFIGIVTAITVVVTSIRSRYQFFSRSVLLLLAVQVGFLSLFYSFESRYILYAIPVLLLAFAIALQETVAFVQKHVSKKYRSAVPIALVTTIGLVFLGTNALRLKNQVMLNLRHAETPWWYLSVIDLNKYFADNTENKPIVITAISPYLIDYYSNNNYKLLPLANQQDFNRDERDQVAAWGPNDYSDLLSLYRQKLLDGNEVYVSKYGLGHEADKIAAFQAIQDTFSLELVQSGCYDLCNIYQLHL
ncbi:MAG: hypothetical protein GW947_02875 [Candidatus Pacebacteria bacterium]|nr:hypothetical protein [Candidatus Paceibacterota bacterium]PIR59489.1 MAG: hypothetical protein COU68_05295 [Candidatus Pacebacteria bacterium CG10_big_fil_rev_8_21_14_0_10_45_6]